MTDCLFCKINSRKIPARIVHEDESVLAFEDKYPQAPVHILIIPKKHISTSLELTEHERELIGKLFLVANKIALENGIAGRGFRLVVNTNPEAGQSIYHVHLHLLGGRPMYWPPG